MRKNLRYGMVGGGPGAFIGDAHRRAISVDDTARLVAGCFSRDPEKSRVHGNALGLDTERCYESYKEMALAEGKRKDGIDFVAFANGMIIFTEDKVIPYCSNICFASFPSVSK